MAGKIAIVGAGAKAAAIVARASVLSELKGGASVPEITVFEKDGVGAAWSGSYDYTNGALRLCTSGEKDVGFPYQEFTADSDTEVSIAALLHARFSWNSFLVASGRLAEWVERGRQHPSHRAWAQYLAWVFKQADCWPTEAEVTAIRHTGTDWQVVYRTSAGDGADNFDAIVLTGSGTPKSVPADTDIPPGRILDAKSFWPQRKTLSSLETGTIMVVGDGGAAGTIAAWLAQAHADRQAVAIASLSPMGTLFPRGDGYSERRWYSDPANWQDLTPEHRQKLIDRTDSGVISLHNKVVIDRAENVHYICGKGEAVTWDDVEEELHVTFRYGDKPPVVAVAHYLINAIGFDGWSNLALVSHPAINRLLADGADDLRKNCADTILPDLSLAPATGLPRGLHVPALGVLAHGPGMSNLGCLGLLATAVLRDYIS